MNQHRGKVIIVAVAVAVVAAIAITAIVVMNNMAREQKEYEQAHAPESIAISLNVPDYGEGVGVPISVKGTDLDGKEVAQTVVLPVAGASVDLLRGDYEISPAGLPISADGRMFSPEQGAVALTVGEGGVNVSGAALPPGVSAVSFSYAPIAPKDVTDEQLSDVRRWMEAAGVGREIADAAVQAATALRQAELDKIAELQRKAEENDRARQDFTARLDGLVANMDYDPLLRGSTREMNEGYARHVDQFKALMNDVLNYLYGMQGTDAAALQADQAAFQQRFDARLAEVESLYAGGSAIGPAMYAEMVGLYRQRIPELIAKIPSSGAAQDLGQEQGQGEASGGDLASSATAPRVDDVTGSLWGIGNAAGASIRSVKLSGDELVIEGELFIQKADGNSDSLGDKTWVFLVDGNTEYGFFAEYFHATTKERIAEDLAGLRFPGLCIVVEGGLVTRLYTSP